MKELIIKSESKQAIYETEVFNVNVSIQSSLDGGVESAFANFNDKEGKYMGNANITNNTTEGLRYDFNIIYKDYLDDMVSTIKELEALIFEKQDTETSTDTEA